MLVRVPVLVVALSNLQDIGQCPNLVEKKCTPAVPSIQLTPAVGRKQITPYISPKQITPAISEKCVGGGCVGGSWGVPRVCAPRVCTPAVSAKYSPAIPATYSPAIQPTYSPAIPATYSLAIPKICSPAVPNPCDIDYCKRITCAPDKVNQLCQTCEAGFQVGPSQQDCCSADCRCGNLIPKAAPWAFTQTEKWQGLELGYGGSASFAKLDSINIKFDRFGIDCLKNPDEIVSAMRSLAVPQQVGATRGPCVAVTELRVFFSGTAPACVYLFASGLLPVCQAGAMAAVRQ